MKKVLFATTALVATAGVASAEVAISGSAEMGIFGGDNGLGGIETQFHTDIDVTFTLSGESDGGIIFGAAVDLDEAENLGNDSNANGDFAGGVGDGANDNDGFAVFISGDFGTLTMGDTDGALDWAMQEANTAVDPGAIADDHTAHAGYLGSYFDGSFYDGQILRYDYAIGDFAVAASIQIDDTGAREAGYGIGATYTFAFAGGSVVIGGGYEMHDATAGIWAAGGAIAAGDFTTYGISAAVALDLGFEATIAYNMAEDSAGSDQTHIGIGVGYSFDAISVHANYGMFEDSFGNEASGFGLAASYDLGGGLSAHLGYGSSERTVGLDTNSFSFGLAMSF